jgi:hypothetical protein
MAALDETRRRFMTYFASIGLGATLAPGIVWARMQDAGTQTVTLAMITEAMKLSGIELTDAERTAMVDAANQNLKRYQDLRAIHIPNDVSPPFHFSALVPGLTVNRTPLPFVLSAPPAVKRPATLEDAAFWPVRHLAELVRTRQVTSLELTEMYLARLHRYNGTLNNVVTFLDDHGRAEAKHGEPGLLSGDQRAEWLQRDRQPDQHDVLRATVRRDGDSGARQGLSGCSRIPSAAPDQARHITRNAVKRAPACTSRRRHNTMPVSWS